MKCLLRRWKETYVLPSKCVWGREPKSKGPSTVDTARDATKPRRASNFPIIQILPQTVCAVMNGQHGERCNRRKSTERSYRTRRMSQITSGYSGSNGRCVPITHTHDYLQDMNGYTGGDDGLLQVGLSAERASCQGLEPETSLSIDEIALKARMRWRRRRSVSKS